MINGTTMGEINNPMMAVLYGKSWRLNPNAANVPRKVEINVEKIVIGVDTIPQEILMDGRLY